MASTESDVALYATQGGGYATYDHARSRYVWHSDIPDFLADAKPGDPIPEEWGVTGPVNDAASREAAETVYSTDYPNFFVIFHEVDPDEKAQALRELKAFFAPAPICRRCGLPEEKYGCTCGTSVC